MCLIVLFVFVSEDLVINPVALWIFASDFESVWAQVVTVAKRAIWCNQECLMLVSMHSSMAAEFQVDAQVTSLGTSIGLADVDELTVVGVVVASPTQVLWVLSMVRGQEECCCREVDCCLADTLQVIPVNPLLCVGGGGHGECHGGVMIGGGPRVCEPLRSEFGLSQCKLCISIFCLQKVRV